MRGERRGPPIGLLRAVPLAILALGGFPAPAPAQAPPPPRDDHGVRFSAFDVGIGAVLPDGASIGLAYAAGAELANFPFHGLATRLAFRFWSADDEPMDVDIDDGSINLLVKAFLERGDLRGYAGLGFGAHFVSARFAETPEIEDERDGFHPGLQLLLGGELGLGDPFLALFLEGEGSVISDVPHATVLAGLRVRFDRLGRR